MCGPALVGYLVLPGSPAAPGLARQFLSQTLCGTRSSAQRDDAARLVTELVQDAVRQVESPVVLRVECGRDQLVLQVGGTSWRSLVAARAAEAEHESRPMALTEALGSCWEVTQYDDGNSLWVRLNRPTGHA